MNTFEGSYNAKQVHVALHGRRLAVRLDPVVAGGGRGVDRADGLHRVVLDDHDADKAVATAFG